MSSTIYGINPADTISLLKERTRRLKQGKEPLDGRKVGLIVEGGAMRGVISCASLLGLEELGMTGVFDEVYGASAGAVNAAYFLAGQAAWATALYYQKINNTRFIRRLWHRRVVDIDNLFESIVARECPLHFDKVLASRSQLFVVIADAHTGEAFLVNAQTSKTPLLTLLKASSAIPLLYNGLVNIDGRECFDGGWINPLPILNAIDAGCTDLLILLTRPASYRDCPPNRLEQRLFELRCGRGNLSILAAYMNACMRCNNLRDIALGRQSIPAAINIATVCPDEMDPKIEQLTRNTQLLRAAAIASARRTLIAFGQPVEEFVEVLRPFRALEPVMIPH